MALLFVYVLVRGPRSEAVADERTEAEAIGELLPE
jgi:hypothetical protein